MSQDKRYAVVRNGSVENVIVWDGISGETWVAPRLLPDDPPLEEGGEPVARYMPQPEDWVPFSQTFGDAQLILDEAGVVGPGWSHNGSVFVPPVVVVTPMTQTEALMLRDSLLTTAALRIAPLQDAVDLGEATPAEEAALLAWKQYRVKLNRVTLQAGFPATIDWPVAPA